ncbi:MAG: tRNA (N6-isopentenyl adenosine(37)-C2)-methylthiotransferase MiaB [Polyangia bacterium]|nr:tRNA (N6-isopentenyl adenosine(37)-C2)-methylthiotransferase MiaB [Polyangia bacterium]
MKLYLKTFGCQMNEYDSARVTEALLGEGFSLAREPEEADLMIYNSCSIREKAVEKLLSAVARGARAKRARPGALLCVTGCTAQLSPERLFEAVPDIDLLVGPDRYGELAGLVREARACRQAGIGQRGSGRQEAPRQGVIGRREASGQILAIERQDVDGYRFLQARPAPGSACPSAFVTIMKGCDNHCAYCVVPAARGPEVSRDGAEVLEEVRRLAEAGAREVFLIGQNVNSYRGMEGGFPALLRAVGEAGRPGGVARVRFTTSHPKDLGPELVEAMARVPEVCEWLHLPVQAGATRVLAAMNRGYTREEYLRKVDMVRAALPGVGITTDLIVGFPGETRAEFEETMSLLREVRYDSFYSFRFSPRPRTPAASLVDDVPLEEKQERLAELQALGAVITREILAAQVGEVQEVLVEGPSKRGGGQLYGRSRRNHVINFGVPEGMEAPPLGTLVELEVTAAGSHTLEGRLVER